MKIWPSFDHCFLISFRGASFKLAAGKRSIHGFFNTDVDRQSPPSCCDGIRKHDIVSAGSFHSHTLTSGNNVHNPCDKCHSSNANR